MLNYQKIRTYSQNCYNEANCKYDGENYFLHISMVMDNLHKYKYIFNLPDDRDVAVCSGFTHDLIEDAKQTYSNICSVAGKDVADVTLAVTDVPAENRLMRHLLTMGKTVKDYRAIIVKMCDMLANASYSRYTKSSMYSKYVEEYQYRKPIFKKALTWYDGKINMNELEFLWTALDEVHNINIE